jgi:hypothetical protein
MQEFKDSVTCLSLKIDSCILTGCIDGSVRLFDMRKGNVYLSYAASTVINDDDDDDDGNDDNDNDKCIYMMMVMMLIMIMMHVNV